MANVKKEKNFTMKKNDRRTPRKNSLSSLEHVRIGGIKQWLLMRGKRKDLPVLLFVHGGPGGSQIGFARHFQGSLEQHFIVVNWDQRGAGLSYSKDIPSNSMRIDQFVSDLVEVTNYLCQRFLQKKIYLVGHSFGTVLSILALQQRPDLYYAYYAVSQVVNIQKGEQISCDFTLAEARRTQNQKAVRQLKTIGSPPWSMSDSRVHQKWLNKFGGGLTHTGNFVLSIFRHILFSSEYKFTDIYRFLKGQYFSIQMMEQEMQNIDSMKQVPRLGVPITFCTGRFDQTTPFELSQAYFSKLEAPQKHWYWFEHSAHSPLFEETELFSRILISTAVQHLENSNNLSGG